MSHDHAPSLTRQDAVRLTSAPISGRVYSIAIGLFVLGAITFVAGLFMDPDRVWRAFHANWLFFATLSSAGVTFVAVQRITTARWSREVIRFMEGYVAFLPVALVFLLLSVLAGKHHIFPWTHEAYPVPEKAVYFNPTFFTLRVLGTFALLTVLGLWYVWTSVRLDVGMNPEWKGASWAEGLRARMRAGFGEERREIHSTHSRQGWLSVLLCMVWGFGWSVLAWDLSMGLSLHFQSALYGWWFFMGGWLNALGVLAILMIVWRKHLGNFEMIRENHFHDIGKLVFAFTAFWGYLTFGQYLVIWYGNLGEETHFMRLRLIAPWKMWTIASVALVFAFPFFGMMGRAAKVYRPTLAFFSLASLTGMWMMRHIEVYPSTYGELTGPAPFGGWELGVLALYLGSWGWTYAKFMDAFPRVRATLLTSQYRDEVQIPVDPETMEPLPAHE
jgi:hypothetical protein